MATCASLKVCSSCSEALSVESFSPRSGRCRPCRNAHLVKWNGANRETRRKQLRERYARDPKVRAKHKAQYAAAKALDPDISRKRRLAIYGMTLEDFDRLLREQDGVCAICLNPESIKNAHLCVDHCHDTGRVRGLLCRNCNSGIGKLKDSPDLLRSALEYLNG